MVNVRVLGLAVAAFVAGSFVASSELRAFAANTVGSIDIINETILSEDIKNGQVKTADLAGSSVTSAKIAGGAVGNSDIADNAVTKAKLGSDVAGMLTITRRLGSQVQVSSGQTIGAIVSCQSGELVSGGGYVGSSSGLIVFQSVAGDNNDWSVSVRNPTANQATITPVVLCAKLSP